MATAQIERVLQQEVMLRLKTAWHKGELQCAFYPIPNGLYIPARNAAEKTMAARVVLQLKASGGLTPGAPDLVFLAAHGSGAIELKRPETRTLLDVRRKGALSPAQKQQRNWLRELGVNWAVCSTWEEVRDTLVGWRMMRAAAVAA